MKKITSISVFFLALALTFFSCKKGQFASEHYTADVVIASSQLTSTRLEVQFDADQSRDSLVAGKDTKKAYVLKGDEITKGKPVKFKVYKAGTNELVADTSFVLNKSTSRSFKIIYNESLNLAGFLTNTGVPADSIRVRMIYYDNTVGKRFPKLEWHFVVISDVYPYYSDKQLDLSLTLDAGTFSHDFSYPAFRYDADNGGNLPISIAARLKDPNTGKYLTWIPLPPEGNIEWFYTPFSNSDSGYAGNYYIVTYSLSDNYSQDGVAFYNLDSSAAKL